MAENAVAEVDPKTAESSVPASPIEALESVTEKPEGERARDDKGRFKAEEQARKDAEVRKQMEAEFPELVKKKDIDVEQPEAGAVKPAEGSKPKASESTTEAAQPTARQIARATDVLSRLHVSKERIDALSPVDRVALAKELKPTMLAQQEAARNGNASKASPTTPGQGTGSPAGEPREAPQLDLKEAVEDLKKDVDPAVVAKLEKLLMAAVTPLQRKLAEAEAKAAQNDEAALWRNIDTSREALVDRFPELADDETWDEDVKPMVLGLASTGKFSPTDLQRLVVKAAIAADLQEVTKQAKEDNATEARLRANGTASARSKTVSKTQTRDEQLALAVKLALDDRIPVEEARRRVYGP